MKLMILDGNSVVNRAFYGVGYLSSRSGQPTGAIYGFLNIMQSLLDEEQPDALCVAFDEKGPTFRHEAYAGYKATRKPMPEDLASQIPILKEILAAMNIPMYSLPGWEADDILGTAGKICGSEGWDCVVVTGDRDSLQLVDDHVTVKLVTTKGGRTQSVNYTPQVFESEYGFPPKGLIDLKALMGDSSDNYPGVPGIGEKTAKDLMAKFGSLDNVYANAEDDSLKPAVKRKLAEGKESAYQSYDLATIRCCAPVSFVPEENRIRKWDRAKVLELFRQLEFGRLIEKYRLLEPDDDSAPAEETKLTVIEVTTPETVAELQSAMRFIRPVGVAVTEHLDGFALAVGDTVYTALETDLGLVDYPLLLEQLWGKDVIKICHDSKTIRSELLRRCIRADGIEYDTALGAYLLEPARSKYNPTDLAQQYCGRTFPEGLSGQAAAILALGTALPKLVRDNGMEAVYRDIDFPLCPVLAEMESAGIAVDKNTLESFGAMLSDRISDCESLIYSYAGGPFNINSTKQLGTLLFETLGLPHGKKTKSGYSTNIDVLEQLREKHPIIPAIIDYRMLTKLHSTYAEGLLKVIAPDGRIHSTFQNTVTATGRLSSTDPNLQNIPVRTELGGEIRKMFVARPGWVLVDADCPGPCGGRQGHAGRILLRRGLPHPHRRPGLWSCARRGHAANAPQREGRQLRHCLRHLRFLPGRGYRRQPQGGKGLYRRISQPLSGCSSIYGRRCEKCEGIRVCGEHVRPAPPAAGASQQQLQRPLRGGTDGTEHTNPGNRRGHHQDRHDPGAGQDDTGRTAGKAGAPGP